MNDERLKIQLAFLIVGTLVICLVYMAISLKDIDDRLKNIEEDLYRNDNSSLVIRIPPIPEENNFITILENNSIMLHDRLILLLQEVYALP